MGNKVYILTEGGSQVGYGHVIRCSALYDEIATRNYDVEFVINGDEKVADVLGKKKFTLKDWRDKGYLSNLLSEENYVIIDSYLADREIYEYISKIVKKSLYIDDNQRIEYPKGIVVNPSIYGDQLNYTKNGDVQYLLGLDYVVLRKEFIDVPEKEIKNRVEDILITFGGADVKNMTPKILNELNERFSTINKHVVIGKGFNNIDEIKSRSDKNTKFYYNLNSQEMKNLMLKCDFAISAAGQTIYELLRIGIPFIPIQVADNQENNIKGLEKIGVKKVEIGDIRFIKKGVSNLIDGKGVERIIDYLLLNCFIRKLKINDMKNIFELSNEDYVRKYSLNKEKILWKNHEKWFEKQLDNKQIMFFIVESLNREFLGQIKFELNQEKREALISISFDRKLKGKGMGKTILKNVINKFILKNENTKYIKAIIDNKNIPSYKLFQSLNFILTNKGEEFSEYIKKI